MSTTPLHFVWNYDNVDRAFWEEHFENWLPRRLVDAHTHISHSRFRIEAVTEARRHQYWVNELQEPIDAATAEICHRTVFPNREFTCIAFGWSTANPRLLEVMHYTPGGAQTWEQVQTGYEPAFKTVTGAIFEFGFSDSLLQMWAAFLHELVQGRPLKKFAGCVTPEETVLSHQLLTAALESQRNGATIPL